jgi:tetraacyldisaccharide 4'-kinase
MRGGTVFKVAVELRKRLYGSGILQTKRLDHPVVSIGNLTLGGTGKTPLTIFLAEKLAEYGFRPVVLSRGYRRTTRGCVIVSRGEGPITSWNEAGDEPYLMARRLIGRAAVVVGESRYLAGVAAQREGLGNLFLLDDGFQHLQLHRDFDIVTIDPDEWLGGEMLLPTGRWREPKSAITRAQAACIQGDRALDLPIPQFSVRLEVDTRQVEALKDKSITAFAGIAKPERFFSTLESSGLRIHRRLAFSDHHNYSAQDIQTLKDQVLLTTEKDAVKLEGRCDFVALRVSANIADVERLQELMLQRLRPS